MPMYFLFCTSCHLEMENKPFLSATHEACPEFIQNPFGAHFTLYPKQNNLQIRIEESHMFASGISRW